MQIKERQIHGVSIIDVSGDLTVPGQNARALREKVIALLHRGDRRILLNFANLRHMDSSCLGEVVASYKLSTSTGAMLKLAQPGSQLRNLLRATTLDRILEWYATEAEAIASMLATLPPDPSQTTISTAPL